MTKSARKAKAPVPARRRVFDNEFRRETVQMMLDGHTAALVMYRYSRGIMGWELAETMTDGLTLAALRRAIRERQPRAPLIHHAETIRTPDERWNLRSPPVRQIVSTSQVISEDADSVTIQAPFTRDKQIVLIRIRFPNADTYWFDNEQPNVSECFRRVN